MTEPRPQRMIAEAHRRAVQEYLRAVMQKRISFRSAEERKDGAERMVREAEQLRFLFRKLASVSAPHLPAGTCLAWGAGGGRLVSQSVRRPGLPPASSCAVSEERVLRGCCEGGGRWAAGRSPGCVHHSAPCGPTGLWRGDGQLL